MRACFVTIVLCSCASSAPPPLAPSPLPSVQDPPAELAVALDGGFDTSLPEGAPWRATFDLGAVESWASSLTSLMGPRDVAEIERALDLPPGALASGSILAAIGLEPGRPTVAAMAPLDASWQPVLRRIEDMARRLPPAGPLSEADERAFEEVWASHPSLQAWLRIVVPAHDAARAVQVVRTLARLGGVRSSAGSLSGYDAVIADGPLAVGISHDATSIVLDVCIEVVPAEAVSSRPEQRVSAVARFRARRPGSGSPPLPLAGDIGRIELQPAGLASLGLAQSMELVQAALSAVAPADRRALRAQGIREAIQILRLAGNERGAYFDRVLLAARGVPGRLEVELTADLGPAMAVPPEARGPSIELGSSPIGADSSVAWTDALRSGGYSFDLARQIQEGGTWATAVAAPLVAALWPEIGFAQDGALLAGARDRCERVGVLRSSFDGPGLAFGLLPAGATAADAARAARSTAGASRVVRVADRYVVLAAADRDTLAAAPALSLTAGPVPPSRGQIDLAALIGPMYAAVLSPWIGAGPVRSEADVSGRTLRVLLR